MQHYAHLRAQGGIQKLGSMSVCIWKLQNTQSFDFKPPNDVFKNQIVLLGCNITTVATGAKFYSQENGMKVSVLIHIPKFKDELCRWNKKDFFLQV